MSIFRGSFHCPLGSLTLTVEKGILIAIEFGQKAPTVSRGPVLFLQARQQILQYCRGELQEFTLPYRLEGTPFRVKVWQAMARIPFGKCWSYKELARRACAPRAFRAVGGACHHNPLPLVIPCHRVIGSDGSLTGFGGGVDLKQQILYMEQTHICAQ